MNSKLNNFIKNFDFKPELLEELNRCKLGRFEKNELIIKQATYIKYLPILLTGTLRVAKHTEEREILLYYINEGNTCGMTLASTFNTKPTSYEISAANASDVLLVPTSKISQWILQFPEWNKYIIHTLIYDQEKILDSFDHVAFDKMNKRISDYLIRLYKIRQDAFINITHQKIADELGTTRVVISRILKSLEQEGSLELNRGAIRIKDITKLYTI